MRRRMKCIQNIFSAQVHEHELLYKYLTLYSLLWVCEILTRREVQSTIFMNDYVIINQI